MSWNINATWTYCFGCIGKFFEWANESDQLRNRTFTIVLSDEPCETCAAKHGAHAATAAQRGAKKPIDPAFERVKHDVMDIGDGEGAAPKKKRTWLG